MDVGAKIGLVFAQKRRRPIRIRTAEQRVAMPSVEVEINWIRYVDTWIHALQNGKYFGLHLFVRQGLDAFREVTLAQI